MSPFAVDYPADVLADLADVWLRAPDRQAVTNAQAQIDQLLSANPIGNGRHLAEGLFQLQVSPLCVSYAVDLVQRRVEINSLHAIP
jgi:hypothetical protein